MSPAEAENSSELLQWSYFSTKIKLDKIHPKLSLRETFSPRFKSNLSELDVLLLRNEIFYEHNDNFTSSLGYDFYGIFNDSNRVENRLAEQFLYKKDLNKRWSFTSRIRLEERFQTDFDLRLRNRFGLSYKVNPKTRIVFADEIFQSFLGGQYLEQNRINLGLERKISEKLKVTLTYLLQQFFSDDELNHVIVTRFNFSL
ncbi:MAG: DUF2490 domain-containing protein [Candidatus Caenarcaniphilales bacterium]|nr:DUF2490 domain-containing protein [Candidatus Caenarcaniphilales bacterium]